MSTVTGLRLGVVADEVIGILIDDEERAAIAIEEVMGMGADRADELFEIVALLRRKHVGGERK